VVSAFVTAFVTAAARTTAADKAAPMLHAPIVVGVSNLPMTVDGAIGMEVVEGLFAAIGEWPVVPVARIVTIINVSVPAVRTVIPGTGSDEDTAVKPIRPIVAIGGAVIGSIVKVAVRADRRPAKIDADRYLRSRRGCRGRGCTA
jgi:hypothetical protein